MLSHLEWEGYSESSGQRLMPISQFHQIIVSAIALNLIVTDRNTFRGSEQARPPIVTFSGLNASTFVARNVYEI